MNEQGVISNASAVDVHDGAQAASGPDATAPVSYGARLASQRQSAGLGVTDVAAQLRLHPNQVRAIEQEDLARLPAPAYVRGFVRSYARMLKIDPSPLLSDLNAKLEPARESVVEGGVTDYSAARAASRELKFPQWMFGSALLVLIALGVVGWLATQQQQPPSPTPVAVATPPAAALVPAPTEPAAPVSTGQTTASQTTASEATASQATAREGTAGEATASTAAADPVPAPTDTAEPTVASSAIASGAAPTLVLRFNGASWAEVTDRGGKILLSQLNSEGQEHSLDGELPLTVVIGDANFASVEVRGAAFNLRPFTRNNVARFTIK